MVRLPRSCEGVARGEPSGTTFLAPRGALRPHSLDAALRTPWLLRRSPEVPCRGHADRLLEWHPGRERGLLSGHCCRVGQTRCLWLPRELPASHGVRLAARRGGSSTGNW